MSKDYNFLDSKCARCGKLSNFGGYRESKGWLCGKCLEEYYENKTKCECGVDAAGGGKHSSWCTKSKEKK